MTSAPQIGQENIAEASAKLLKPSESKLDKPFNFADFENILELSPAMTRIYNKLADASEDDGRLLLENLKDLVEEEMTKIAEVGGEKLKQWQEFKIRIEEIIGEEKMLRGKEHTFVSARSVFENAIINAVNEGLPEAEKITSSDGDIILKWLEDGSKEGGHFVLVKRKHKPYSEADEPGENITLVDENGKKYNEKKLLNQTQRSENMESAEVLETEHVKAVFDKLPLEVKKIFLNGLKEQMKDITTYDKNGQEKAIANIENELAALK